MDAVGNKALARRWFDEFFNERNLEVIEEIIASDHTVRDPSHLDLTPGPEGQRELLDRYLKAFPDARIVIEDQIADENHAISRYTFYGTHGGDGLPGYVPRGEEVVASGIQIDRISEGRIEETWVNWDTAGVLSLLIEPGPRDWPKWPPWR
jgi:predicted ester cyclase